MTAKVMVGGGAQVADPAAAAAAAAVEEGVLAEEAVHVDPSFPPAFP